MVSVLCGAETWGEVVLFGRSHFDYFGKRLPGLSDIPCQDTFSRFFTLLDVEWFEESFRLFVDDLCRRLPGVVAIDGEATCKNPRSPGSGMKDRLYMVSAWAADNGLCLGQRKADGKSNEMTAIPELIKLLDLEQCMVTIDAMGCQKNIAQTIVDHKADYIGGIKANQRNLYEYCQKMFSEEERVYLPACYGNYVTEENAHGRSERRECIVYHSEVLPYFFEEWKGLKSFVKIISTRKEKGKEETTQTRYYMTSLGKEPQLLSQAIRTHWNIENNLHWQLDVSFREDYTRKTDNAAVDFSAICKIALMLLKRNERKKISIAAKRKRCGWDEKYRDQRMGIKEIAKRDQG